MKFVALIPARGGSKRIPRKNLQIVGGETLIERAIHCAQDAKIIERVYVSTDDDEIGAVSLRAGASVIQRPKYLAQDETKMEDVLWDFLLFQTLSARDIVVLLEPTAPLRTPQDIYAVCRLMLTSEAPAARIVGVDKAAACHGYVYRDVGLASAVLVGSFKDCLFPRGTVLLHDGDERAIDVDEPADLERARAIA